MAGVNRAEAFGAIAAQAVRGELSFPTSVNAVLRLQQALNDPECQLEEAVRLTLGEPRLAAHTVALANSSAFNSGGKPITNVRMAVTRIGFRNLQMLVASLLVRLFGSHIEDPGLRRKAELLWQHTVQVAALAYLFARRVTCVNPDTAMFAGIVHEVGGFYVLSRADAFPGLLDDDPAQWAALCGDAVTRELARRLALPEAVADAIVGLRGSWLHMPPSSLIDTLLLANLYADVPSPLSPAPAPLPDHSESVLDFLLDETSLREIRADAAELSALMGPAMLA
jgi:HD-like signal output (HDOD) protein